MLVSSIVIEIKILLIDQILNHFVCHIVCCLGTVTLMGMVKKPTLMSYFRRNSIPDTVFDSVMSIEQNLCTSWITTAGHISGQSWKFQSITHHINPHLPPAKRMYQVRIWQHMGHVCGKRKPSFQTIWLSNLQNLELSHMMCQSCSDYPWLSLLI
jgi:hypothetical protein